MKINIGNHMQTPIGDAIKNLASAYMSGPTPLEQDVLRQRAAYDRQRTQALQDAANAQTQLGTLVGEVANYKPAPAVYADEDPLPFTPAGPAPAEFIRSRAGDMTRHGLAAGFDPQGLAQMMLQMQANFGGGEEDMRRGLVGAGHMPNADFAATTARADEVSARNAGEVQANELAKIAATPLTLSQTQGKEFTTLPGRMRQLAVGPTETQTKGTLLGEEFQRLGNLTPQQQEVLGARVAPTAGQQTRDSVTLIGPQGERVPGSFDRADGSYRFGDGTAVPAGWKAYKLPQPQGSDAELGLTTKTRGDLEGSNIAFQDFQSTMKMLRDVASSDPTLFGAAGNVRRAGQAASQQLNALGQAFGADTLDGAFGNAAAQLQAAGVAPQYFDPNLTDIGKLATLAAYQAAATLASQEGRGLSDKDFEKFRGIIGDPTDWLASQPQFLAGLDRMETLAGQMNQTRQNMLRPGSAPAPAGPAPAAPQVQKWGRDAQGNPVRVQ